MPVRRKYCSLHQRILYKCFTELKGTQKLILDSFSTIDNSHKIHSHRKTCLAERN